MVLSPGAATIGANGRITFCAIVTGAINPDVSWSASAGSIVSVGTGRGRLTAPSVATLVIVTATSVEDSGKSDLATITVITGFATVSGRVLRSSSTTGIAGIVIEFRNAAGSVVAQVTTASCGDFGAAVPVTATRFHLQNGSVPSGFYKQYTYDTLRYTTVETTCSAPLPALSADTAAPLVTNITIPPTTQPPPPPPNGCP